MILNASNIIRKQKKMENCFLAMSPGDRVRNENFVDGEHGAITRFPSIASVINNSRSRARVN